MTLETEGPASRMTLIIALLVPGALVAYLSFSGGGFFAGTTAIAAVVMLVVLVVRVTLARNPLEGLSRLGAVAGAALAAFAVWTLASGSWSDAPSTALLEFDRALLYVTTFLLLASVRRAPTRARWLVRALAAAIVGVCLCGLVSRVLPEIWPIAANVEPDRLSYPLTYWNAMGLMAAFGLIACLHLTSDTREPAPLRVVAAAALPLTAATLLLTYSRAAIVLGGAGLLLYLLATRPRGAISGILAAGPPGAIAVIATYGADRLSSNDPVGHAAVEQGEGLALVLLLCALGAGGVRALLVLLDRRIGRLPSPSRRTSIAAWGTVAVVALGVTVAVGLPGQMASEYEQFVDQGVVKEGARTRERLTDVSNNGRIEFWRVAWEQRTERPLSGQGAGRYASLWARERPSTFQIADAHSLYLEVLSELGLVGLALLLFALVLMLVALAARTRGPEREVWGLMFTLAAVWAVHAGIDWDWEMPVLTLPIFAMGGLAASSDRASRIGLGGFARVAVGVALLLLATTPLLIALSQARLNNAVTAFKRGDCVSAIDSALGSLQALGERPEPYEVLGYCDARIPRLAGLAIQMMERAVERDPAEWRYRYGLAVVRGAARRDPRAAVRRALELNPREKLTRDLTKAFATNDPRTWERRARRARLPFSP